MYTQYCASQPQLLASVEEDRKTDKKLAAFLDDIKFNKDARNLDIGQYLLKPIQRVCKYPLILGELLKQTQQSHVDYPRLRESIEKVKCLVLAWVVKSYSTITQTAMVVDSINRGQKLLETFTKVAELAADIKNDVDFDILSGNRSFIREGQFMEIVNDKKISCTLVLFDDVLILGKYSSKKHRSSSSGTGSASELGKGFCYRSHW
jgi:hypothetical protein